MFHVEHYAMYDVIVVGAGHAGCEAAHAAGTMGSKVLLITMNMETIAKMSCNPAMGGVAKGQIVREIDALGGMSGIITDHTMIQFRMLNRSKGPAMWSPRAQSDRVEFALLWRQMLEANTNVDFYQDMVVQILEKGGSVCGVKTGMGNVFHARSVVITSGTFLNGKIHIGKSNYGGGRMGERQSTGITACLEEFGFQSGRMKTGTPPRVDGRSLDYSKMEEQPGDNPPGKFSYLDTPALNNQLSCHITYTNDTVHDILRDSFQDSPLFNGSIQGLGPRYCPSIEDKINRFAQRERHQIFVEPEGRNTVEVYVNGFSTSLPLETQFHAIKHIPGFENVRIFRPGYAIEYDYFPPTQLKHSLETKLIAGLFFAGQINGTTGYEEAASQGLIAGINAHQYVTQQEAFILDRSEAYIGVLIDDLITKGTDEPYRMFTSRAEFRLLLRQDNADQRLTPKGVQIGLASKSRSEQFQRKMDGLEDLESYLRNQKTEPNEINPILTSKDTPPINQSQFLSKILLRPQIELSDFQGIERIKAYTDSFSEEIKDSVQINIKYEGYLHKEQEHVEKMHRLEHIRIPETFNFESIRSLSSEGMEKMKRLKPATIGQASRISGVSASDISVLLVHLGR
ncbi:MAG: tRNA uridine-5-carboxymethylaminomethyl(34) synthesis enzyme MnmG [Flavobacteriales bacterium]|nr:tRNA uridine-5-carboxymethylaminomethyl(34) synthesis enzyme MnmG [Flavobacteriales bacterium]